MTMSGYTKLFSSIVASTIWREDDKTRIVWITLLALSDKDGFVAGSIPGLADLARVSVADCELALEKLQQPDPYSRTSDHEGRRIEIVEGGWFILNRAKYRDLIPNERRRERDRIRQQRHRQCATVSRVTECDSHDLSHQTKEEEEKKTTTTPEQSQSSETSSTELPKQPVIKKKRRTKVDMLSDFSAGTSVVVNTLLPEWPRSQPKDGSAIRIDLAAVAGRVDNILRDNADANPELLIAAARMYLAESRQFFHAPQFFFGPANGNEAPWVAYARMIVHQASKSQTAEVV